MRSRANNALVVVAVFSAACTSPRPHRLQQQPESNTCFDCHGTVGVNPAPPPVSWDRSAPPDPHQPHLQPASWHPALACDNCHVVPHNLSEHPSFEIDKPAPVRFVDEAVAQGATPTYDPNSKTCGGTYCHGANLSGGRLTAPSWLAEGQNQAACGNCHSLPPTRNHPQDSRCERCHGQVIDAERNFVAPELHIDGIVETSATGCDTCHGSNGDPAPPVDISGNSSTTAIGVGAHRQHLATSAWHVTLACGECHKVPVSVSDPGHVDTPAPAEVIFGPIATADNAAATWDHGTATCTVYCHDAGTLDSGGTHLHPLWTEVDGTQSACGSCHALPPTGLHPPRSDCATCHGAVVDSSGTIVHPDLHINGTVDVAPLTCNLCHGNLAADPSLPANWAPPLDVEGHVEANFVGVGAHQPHMTGTLLAGSEWHRMVVCSDCHTVPAHVNDPGHLGQPPAPLTFGSVATADGAHPSFAAATNACNNVYCHGSSLIPGGSNTTPVWTGGADEAACGTCHGLPPGPPHVTSTHCEACHGEVWDGTKFIRPDLHIDGTVEVRED